MSNTSGWNLTGRLVVKHLGALGNNIAAAIANFDPETATEADRDALAARLRDVAMKFSAADNSLKKEQKDVDTLRAQIEGDLKVAAALGERLAAGTVDEATVNLFLDELQAAQDRLPGEEAEAQEAQAFLDEIKSIMDAISTQLTQFDAHAAKAKRELEQAKTRLQQQEMREQQSAELRAAAGNGAPSTALGALQNRAAKLQAKADGLKVVNDVTDRPAQNAAKLNDLRKSVLTGTTAAPSAADRLKALTAGK